MSELDKRIAEEIGDLADNGFASSDFLWRNYISWVERGMPSMPEPDRAALRVDDIPESEQIVPAIPIIGTIDSETGVITYHAPLPEPPAPLTAENYAAGRMPFWAWLVGALGIGVAVAIAAVMVLADRVRKGGAK